MTDLEKANRINEISAELAYLDGETMPTQRDNDLVREKVRLQAELRETFEYLTPVGASVRIA